MNNGTFILAPDNCSKFFTILCVSFCRILFVLRTRIYVCSFPNNPKEIMYFETRENPKGTCIEIIFIFYWKDIIRHEMHLFRIMWGLSKRRKLFGYFSCKKMWCNWSQCRCFSLKNYLSAYLCGLCVCVKSTVLVKFIWISKFSYFLKDLSSVQPGISSSPVTITAHQGEIACIALNQLGEMAATASDKVTLHLCRYLRGRWDVILKNTIFLGHINTSI